MVMTDPVADMLTRIRNANSVYHDKVEIPASRIKQAIAQVLKAEGFIKDFEVVREESHKSIKLYIKYQDRNQPVLTGLERVSKPGLRIYVEKKEIPRVYGGMGIAILSTPKGVMTGRQAWHQGIGGELLCYVW